VSSHCAIFEQVVRLAKAVVPGADHASLTLVENDKAHTPTFTGEIALQLDERQYETGYGPCLDAAASGRTITILDPSNEQPYPDFATQAHSLGVRRVMSVALPVPQRTLGAINMYSMGETPFEEAGTESARGFASHRRSTGQAVLNLRRQLSVRLQEPAPERGRKRRPHGRPPGLPLRSRRRPTARRTHEDGAQPRPGQAPRTHSRQTAGAPPPHPRPSLREHLQRPATSPRQALGAHLDRAPKGYTT
jgi:hypothetical protein